MNQYIEYFTNYVNKNYDTSDILVARKYYHSLRVAWLMVRLAKKMNLDEEDTMLAFKLGLCHDLGRFYEAIRNGVFNNCAFDHATYSNKILYNDKFVNYMDVDDDLLFRKAIYCHNKKDLASNLDYKEEFFANMLRDTDKIDLLKLRSIGKRLEFFKEPTKVVYDSYLSSSTIDIHDIHSSSDSIILYLSFAKDLIFDASYDILIEEDILNNLLSIIDVSKENEDIFNYLIQKIKEKRGKVYVR